MQLGGMSKKLLTLNYSLHNGAIMKIDKHYDPTDDLEKELLQELDDIARQLQGKITYSSYGNSMGKSSKTVTIEYDITE